MDVVPGSHANRPRSIVIAQSLWFATFPDMASREYAAQRDPVDRRSILPRSWAALGDTG